MKSIPVLIRLVCAASLLTVQALPAQEGKAKTAAKKEYSEKSLQLAQKLVEVSGQMEAIESTLSATIEESRKNPAQGLPEGFWDEFEKEFKKSLPALVEELTPIYAKHFSDKEIEDLIAFYQTDTGKKFAEKQPLIIADATKIGSAWGGKIGQAVAEKLSKEK